MDTAMSVAVVGGSISGCAITAALLGQGHDVVLFERSLTDRRSQGAAIVTPLEVLNQLEAVALIEKTFPRCPAGSIRYLTRGGDAGGRPLGRVQLALATFEWADLFHALRDRVPDDRYLAGRAVTGVDDGNADRPCLQFLDGTTEGPYDLVVFADGYRSIGRPLVSGGTHPQYLGQVFWRGLVDGDELDDVTDTVTRALYDDGHAAFYQIPKNHGEAHQLMWGCYRPVSPEELPTLLVDDAGTAHAGSTPMGKVRPEVRARFLRELQQRLPAAYLDVIRGCEETSIQAVFTEQVDRYTQGRLCVIGDAGTIFPPYAGSGVLKAVGNALSLAASLANVDPREDIGAALSAWSDQQLTTDASLTEQSRRNGRLLSSQVQELEAFSTEAVLAWLNEVHPGVPAFSDI